ncbi:MAG: hypothetical protein FJ271_12990 [Planctomycetes bacterium]|nr:hypothetical protein [Planctomycetota bacterium]
MPEEEVGEDWEAVLKAGKSMVLAYIDRPSLGRDRLQSALAVTIGFVDGSLESEASSTSDSLALPYRRRVQSQHGHKQRFTGDG